ncbi:MAG TPA: hypothetical protein QF720_07875 [Nitrospinota bacterium]|nr:hypothetical protein [Nitrospinota bacterium]|tara:strand:- start:254199 stop:254639 length:441 start_codon:yes stop_codon:yes gene_type:complete
MTKKKVQKLNRGQHMLHQVFGKNTESETEQLRKFGKKNILVIIADPPGFSVAEKLRMCVGLTLEENNTLSVLMIDNGAYVGLGTDKSKTSLEIDKHLETLSALSVVLCVSKFSVDERSLVYSKFIFKLLSNLDIEEMMTANDIIIN